MEVSTFLALLSIWFLPWLNISQGLDSADRKSGVERLGLGDAGSVGDADESSSARR